MSPFQTGCSRVAMALLLPFPRVGPSLCPRQPQWGHAMAALGCLGSEQGHRVSAVSAVRPGEDCLVTQGTGLVMLTLGKTQTGCSICWPEGSMVAHSSSLQQHPQPCRSYTAPVFILEFQVNGTVLQFSLGFALKSVLIAKLRVGKIWMPSSRFVTEKSLPSSVTNSSPLFLVETGKSSPTTPSQAI